MAGTHHNEASNASASFVQANTVRDVYLAPPPPPPPPRQAPSADLRYTNREAEAARVEALASTVLRRGRSGRVLISGRAGIGKSALLAELGHRLTDRFDAGTAHCDLTSLRDHEGNADLSAALRAVLRSLHVADTALVTGTAALMERLRDVTAGRRVLLLVDGVLDDGELGHFTLGTGPNLVVAACAPGSGAATGPVGHGAEQVPLRELRHADGLRLLAEFGSVERRMGARHEHESARQLVDLCAGLPSALRMAAGLLESQEGLSITRLVEAVVARQRTVPGLSGAEAVADVALSGLGEEERRLLELLSAHPGRFFPSELGGLALGERAGQVMDRLTEASILRPAPDSGRDIAAPVRDRIRHGWTRHGADTDTDQDQTSVDAAAILRFFTVSHHRADRASLGERHRLADSLDTAELTVAPVDYTPPFESRRQAVEWQDTHLLHTRDLMRLAVDLDRPVAALLLADSVWPVCYGRRRLEAGTAIYAHALRVAHLIGHLPAQVRCAAYLARLYVELGDGEHAARLLQEAERAAEETRENSGTDPDEDLDLAVVLEARGLLNSRFPEFGAGDTHDLLSRSRRIHRRLRRPRGDAMQTYQLGDQARRRGDLDTAETELREAERIADRRLEELALTGDEQHARWAIDDWELSRARVRLALARTLLESGRVDQARTRADAAWRTFTEAAEPVKEIEAARLLARVAEREGDTDRARALLGHVGKLAEHYHLDEVAREARHTLGTGAAPGQRTPPGA